jgi:hypothetical protein
MHATLGHHTRLASCCVSFSLDLHSTGGAALLLQGDWKDLGALLAWFRWVLPPPAPAAATAARAPALQPACHTALVAPAAP